MHTYRCSLQSKVVEAELYTGRTHNYILGSIYMFITWRCMHIGIREWTQENLWGPISPKHSTGMTHLCQWTRLETSNICQSDLKQCNNWPHSKPLTYISVCKNNQDPTLSLMLILLINVISWLQGVLTGAARRGRCWMMDGHSDLWSWPLHCAFRNFIRSALGDELSALDACNLS